MHKYYQLVPIYPLIVTDYLTRYPADVILHRSGFDQREVTSYVEEPSMSDTAALTSGIHHLGLTVPDISALCEFFVDALGFKQVGAQPEYPAVFVSDGAVLLTLWQTEDPSSATPFNRRKNIGLHHFALRVNDLDHAYRRLSRRDDVSMEFAPEELGQGPTRHMMCAIPGGIRLELIAPA